MAALTRAAARTIAELTEPRRRLPEIIAAGPLQPGSPRRVQPGVARHDGAGVVAQILPRVRLVGPGTGGQQQHTDPLGDLADPNVPPPGAARPPGTGVQVGQGDQGVGPGVVGADLPGHLVRLQRERPGVDRVHRHAHMLGEAAEQPGPQRAGRFGGDQRQRGAQVILAARPAELALYAGPALVDLRDNLPPADGVGGRQCLLGQPSPDMGKMPYPGGLTAARPRNGPFRVLWG